MPISTKPVLPEGANIEVRNIIIIILLYYYIIYYNIVVAV